MKRREDAALINETAVKKLGWKNPIGKKITDHINPAKVRVRKIVGVVKDMHHKPLHEPIEPTMFDYLPNTAGRLTLKLNADNIAHTMKLIEQKWSKIHIDW